MNLDFAITKYCVTLTYTDDAGATKGKHRIYASNVLNLQSDPDYVYFGVRQYAPGKEIELQVRVADITTYSVDGTASSVPALASASASANRNSATISKDMALRTSGRFSVTCSTGPCWASVMV